MLAILHLDLHSFADSASYGTVLPESDSYGTVLPESFLLDPLQTQLTGLHLPTLTDDAVTQSDTVWW